MFPYAHYLINKYRFLGTLYIIIHDILLKIFLQVVIDLYMDFVLYS